MLKDFLGWKYTHIRRGKVDWEATKVVAQKEVFKRRICDNVTLLLCWYTRGVFGEISLQK